MAADFDQPWPDSLAVVVSLAIVAGAAIGTGFGSPWLVGALLVVVALEALRRSTRWPRGAVLIVVGLGSLAGWHGHLAVGGLALASAGPLDGWVEFVTDPEPRGPGTTAIVEIDGRRFVIDAYGRMGRVLGRHTAGDRVWMSGRTAPIPAERMTRLAHRHVSGTFDLEFAGDRLTPRRMSLAANRVRSLLARGARSLPEVERSLFAGLVIGDDRAEPRWLIDDFRRAGLSHLTAVSGQNIGFLLVAAGPLLRRLRPGARWVATLLLIGWFGVLTRFEPSVLRAGAMAVLAATAFWRGWRATAIRMLALVTGALLLVDPLLVASLGWWLSVGATCGLAVLGPSLVDRLPGPRWIAEPIGASLAAQLGVLPVAWFVFGRVPIVALPANVLVGAMAGFVMIWGIPAGLLSGLMPALGSVLQFPTLLAVRWVIVVARVAARIEPSLPAWVAGTVHLLLGAFLGHRPRRTDEHH